jgi:DNA-binding transcriptional MerR regulator
MKLTSVQEEFEMTVPTPDAEDTLLSITEVAAAFGLPISTLRYYDKIGLATASHRRARVRHYDHADLRRLAYVQLWHHDGALSIDRTSAIAGSKDRMQRNHVIEDSRHELAVRIAALTEAHEMLQHVTRCAYDDHTVCPIIRAYLTERVDTALRRSDDAHPREESVYSAMRRVKATLTEARDSGD